MLGEREALVVDVRPFDVHGVAYVDVTVALPRPPRGDRAPGRESVPDDLQPGEEVLVSSAVNMIVVDPALQRLSRSLRLRS